MNANTRFWDRIAEKYARTPVPDEAAYQQKLDTSRRYLKPHMDVVEFGCGTGTTALVHATSVKRIHAVDTSAKMIEIAQRKASQAGVDNVEFTQTDLLSLPLAEASVDAVLGLNVLHLLDNRRETIQRAYDLLKPGGVFITSTPCVAETLPFIRYIAPIGSWLGLMPMVQVFSIAQLEGEMAACGFAIDHKSIPGKNKATCFLVAIKPG